MSLQNTYKGLKHVPDKKQKNYVPSLQNTYKGLKLDCYCCYKDR